MKQFRITILLTVLMSMFGAKAFAHDIAVKNKDGVTIYYKWINNHTELAVSYREIKYNSYNNEYSGHVDIPESIEYEGKTYSVTSIAGEAFRGCSSLTSVTIPNSVTSIGFFAFSGTAWYNNQPDGLVYAGNVAYAYKGTMPANTNITLKEGTLGIAERAFYECKGLTSITIPNSVKSIGSGAFSETAWYDNQPNGLVYAGKVAYAYKGTMPANTAITLEDGTLGITGYAFQKCSGLTSVTIPSSVTSIGERAFSGCSNLKEIKVTVTDLTAFCNKNILFSFNYSNVYVPIMLIDNEGVEIKNFIIPEGVTSIGANTFYYCNGLSSVTIPNSVTSIEDFAFNCCI